MILQPNQKEHWNNVATPNKYYYNHRCERLLYYYKNRDKNIEYMKQYYKNRVKPIKKRVKRTSVEKKYIKIQVNYVLRFSEFW